MIVKIDMDGVIRNIFDNMCDIYNTNFGTNITVDDIFDYDVEVVFPKIREKFGMSAADYFFKEKSVDIFLLSKPYDGVKEAVEKLRNNGHKVVIVTWQYTLDNKLRTLKFLDNNQIPYDDICFTRDKWMIQGDWIIDDNPEFIFDERETAHKMLIRMPYNKGIRFDGLREKSLKKAVNLILKIETTKKIFRI